MLVTPADDKGFDKVVKLIGSTPDEEKLDLDYSNAVTVKREGDKRGGGRDRDRSRGGERGRDRDRNRAPTVPSDVASANLEAAIAGEPIPSAPGAPLPEASEKRPARSRKPRGEKAVAEAVETEVPAVAAEAAPAAERGRRDRGGSSRERGRQPRVEEAVAEQPQVEAERAPRPERAERPERAPERTEGDRPRRERGRDRDRRPERGEQPRAEAERSPAPRAEPAREPAREQERPARGAPLPVRGVQPVRGREDDDDRRVVGFGNDTPAFLMRAPPRLGPPSDSED
jgi:hypothetical protein